MATTDEHNGWNDIINKNENNQSNQHNEMNGNSVHFQSQSLSHSQSHSPQTRSSQSAQAQTHISRKSKHQNNNNNNNNNERSSSRGRSQSRASQSRSKSTKSGRGQNVIHVTYVVRDWTLSKLKDELSRIYSLDRKKLKITYVPDVIQKASNYKKARQGEGMSQKVLTQDNKKLYELDLDHGSKIYITDELSIVSNKTVKDHRLIALQQLLKEES